MSDGVVDSSVADGAPAGDAKEDPQFLRKRSVQMEEESAVTAPPGTAETPAESPMGAPSIKRKMSRKNTAKRGSIDGGTWPAHARVPIVPGGPAAAWARSSTHRHRLWGGARAAAEPTAAPAPDCPARGRPPQGLSHERG